MLRTRICRNFSPLAARGTGNPHWWSIRRRFLYPRWKSLIIGKSAIIYPMLSMSAGELSTWWMWRTWPESDWYPGKTLSATRKWRRSGGPHWQQAVSNHFWIRPYLLLHKVKALNFALLRDTLSCWPFTMYWRPRWRIISRRMVRQMISLNFLLRNSSSLNPLITYDSVHKPSINISSRFSSTSLRKSPSPTQS